MVKFIYEFRFDNGINKEFEVHLDSETLDLQIEKKSEYPSWTKLENFKCPNCPLDCSQKEYCPVVTNLFEVIDFFKDTLSYEEADISIKTDERDFVKRTATQSALQSLVGIYMVTSGCPILGKLKPLTRFHLPFATVDETSFRIISMYLLAQFFVQKRGGIPDWGLQNLVKTYEDIRIVNKNFCDRLSDIAVKDATINALVTLDCFAFTISLFIGNDRMGSLEKLFVDYIRDLS